MRRLVVEDMGDDVQGVRLRGDPSVCPEPVHFRVVFPGGDVDIVRSPDGPDADYWIHVRVNRPDSPGLGTVEGALDGALVDARLDVTNKHASETDAGDFRNPGLYHLAVRVKPEWPERREPRPAARKRGRRTEQ